MDTDSNKTIWTVIIVAAVAIMGGLFVKFVPNITSQMQVYAQTVTGKLSSSSDSSSTVDSSSDSDFTYSDPDTNNDTISITGYTGNKEDVIIPTYRKIGSVDYKVTAINHGAFHYNHNIKQVIIPDSVQTIGEDAFCQAANLTSVTLGSGVTSIGSEAFESTALTSVDFPASLTSIDSWAFAHTPLSSISFKSPVYLAALVFYNTKLAHVTLPKGSTYDTKFELESFNRGVTVTIQ